MAAGWLCVWPRHGLALWLASGSQGRLWAISVGLLIGGAIGNAIDRMRLGGVADFFSTARLRLLLVRVQYRRRGHCCRRDRALV